MKSIFSLAGALLLSVVILPRQITASQSDWDSLVAAERAFAKTSLAKGTREAFLAFLADDSTLFRPNPVPGKKWIEEHPAPSGQLSWEPAFAEVSQSGELGYTTGPWEIRQNGTDDKPSANGEYVSLWKKQTNGDWKVLVDLGVSHPPLANPVKSVQFPTEGQTKSAKSNRKSDLAEERADLLRTERELANLALQKGAAQGYLRYLAEDARLLRMKSFPIVGKREIFATFSQKTGRLSFLSAKTDVSAAADLGYSYGTSSFMPEGSNPASAVSSNYVRIWRKMGGQWKIVLDIENPVQPTTK